MLPDPACASVQGGSDILRTIALARVDKTGKVQPGWESSGEMAVRLDASYVFCRSHWLFRWSLAIGQSVHFGSDGRFIAQHTGHIDKDDMV